MSEAMTPENTMKALGAWTSALPWTPTPTPTGKIALALAKAQGAMGGAKKGAVNTFYKNKYADLGAVCEACRHELAENEISVVQVFHDPGNTTDLLMETILLHSSGERLHSMIRMGIKAGPQEMGKGMTYLRRYGLAAAVVIPQEDDDGQSAQEAQDKKPAPKKRKAKPKPEPEKEPSAKDMLIADLKIMLKEQQPDLLEPGKWDTFCALKSMPGGKLETWSMEGLNELHTWLMETAF